jgi:hypothetical protein
MGVGNDSRRESKDVTRYFAVRVRREVREALVVMDLRLSDLSL